jgi:hypothetical protein
MRKPVVAALIGALTLTGAVTAIAVPPSQTTTDTQFRPGTTRDGTNKKPRINSFRLKNDQGTSTGSGQPATTAAITLVTPAGWTVNSEIWPRRSRCDIDEVNQAGSDSGCPRGARIGSGVVNLLAGDGAIKEVADLRAWVTRTGDIMIFLDSRPGQPVELNAAVLCNVSRRSRAKCLIPETLQRPAGVPSAIDDLTLRLVGTARIRGKRRGILESRRCRRAFVFAFIVEFDDGTTVRDTDRIRCR